MHWRPRQTPRIRTRPASRSLISVLTPASSGPPGTAVVHLDATTPQEVADAVSTHKPTCVLLDLNLRGFTGIEAFRRIREAGASIPVIVVTADPNPSPHRAALHEGVVAIVQKPFSAKHLYALVMAETGKGRARTRRQRPLRPS